MTIVVPLFMMAGILIFSYGAWLARVGLIWLLARISGKRVRLISATFRGGVRQITGDAACGDCDGLRVQFRLGGKFVSLAHHNGDELGEPVSQPGRRP